MNFKRHRRLRKNSLMRDLVRETTLSVNDFIQPLFVKENLQKKEEVASMPGVYQFALTDLLEEVESCVQLGIKSFIIFGIPDLKDEVGSEASNPDGIVQKALRLIKQHYPDLILIADTCLCEFTSHGHCGILDGETVVNDLSLERLVQVAISQAEAGADIIAPSNAMDGFVAVIREGLDKSGFGMVPIMSYSVKFASSFYGPFRDAGQMDPANRLEALREAQSDEEEGADFLMVKPALAFLDVLRDLRNQSALPLVAYNVSGEYSMIKAASAQGWIDERAVVMESLIGMKRAGADLIITYFAKDVAGYLKG